MSNKKSPLERIYRLKASHACTSEKEAKVSFVMMYASGAKSLGLEDEGSKQFMERSLDEMCSDNKENLKEYLLKIKDKFPYNELLSVDWFMGILNQDVTQEVIRLTWRNPAFMAIAIALIWLIPQLLIRRILSENYEKKKLEKQKDKIGKLYPKTLK